MRLTAVLLAAAFLLCLSATASAAETTKKVDGEMIFEYAETGPSSCAAVVFVQWKDQRGEELRATAFYTTTRGKESKAAAAPFKDVYFQFRAPMGHHRILVGESGKAHFDGTTRQDCSDLNAKHKEIIFDRNVVVQVTTGPTPRLAVTVRASGASRARPGADTTLTVSVKNTGRVPVESVTVDSEPVIKVIKRSCPGAVLRTGNIVNISQGTIAPGETHRPAASFEVTHVCPGTADVIVTVRGSTADGSLVIDRGRARVVVPYTARIRGTVEPVPAWSAEPYRSERLRPDEVEKLRRGVIVRAKGPKGTLSARVSPSGTYEIEVPRKALGRYVITTSAPNATELRPARAVVNLRAGQTVVRHFETGYSCEAKLPGRGFAVKGGAFNGSFASYRCRSRRLVLVVPLPPGPRRDDQHITTCRRADGSTYEVGSSHNYVELLLAMGTDGVLRGGHPGFGNLSVTATFSTPDSVAVRVDSTDCLDDSNFELKRSS